MPNAGVTAEQLRADVVRATSPRLVTTRAARASSRSPSQYEYWALDDWLEQPRPRSPPSAGRPGRRSRCRRPEGERPSVDRARARRRDARALAPRGGAGPRRQRARARIHAHAAARATVATADSREPRGRRRAARPPCRWGARAPPSVRAAQPPSRGRSSSRLAVASATRSGGRPPDTCSEPGAGSKGGGTAAHRLGMSSIRLPPIGRPGAPRREEREKAAESLPAFLDGVRRTPLCARLPRAGGVACGGAAQAKELRPRRGARPRPRCSPKAAPREARAHARARARARPRRARDDTRSGTARGPKRRQRRRRRSTRARRRRPRRAAMRGQCAPGRGGRRRDRPSAAAVRCERTRRYRRRLWVSDTSTGRRDNARAPPRRHGASTFGRGGRAQHRHHRGGRARRHGSARADDYLHEKSAGRQRAARRRAVLHATARRSRRTSAPPGARETRKKAAVGGRAELAAGGWPSWIDDVWRPA